MSLKDKWEEYFGKLLAFDESYATIKERLREAFYFGAEATLSSIPPEELETVENWYDTEFSKLGREIELFRRQK